MKKCFLLFSFIAIFAFGTKASESVFTVNDDAVNSAISNAVEMTMAETLATTTSNPFSTNEADQLSAKNGWAAAAICFFLGGLGIHRHYLGTSSMMWLYYCITCGGIGGIVPLIDFVVLVIAAADNNVRKYENNDSFFMWN